MTQHIHQGRIPFQGHQTWYRITGDLSDSSLTPLVVVHGGPGCTHDYIDAFVDLAESGRPIIHYDQIGNGNSTHLPWQQTDFWQVNLFLEEIDNLLVHLGIIDNFLLLGQSWGGMLCAEQAVRQPSGLKGLIIANSPASMQLWLQAASQLRSELPEDIQQCLQHHEMMGTTATNEYKAATQVFYQRHVCRLKLWPDEVVRTFSAMDKDPTVYHAMNGPTEFHVIGSLKNWSIIARLPQINVPTLLISGRYDEATPECVQPYYKSIPQVEWEIFSDSSHMPHVEERRACMKRISQFLEKYEL